MSALTSAQAWDKAAEDYHWMDEKVKLTTEFAVDTLKHTIGTFFIVDESNFCR
jgi:hypothetical protein